VSLYEALYGTRPFAGATARELVRRKNARELTIPPDERAVPGWLRAAIVRGLAANPEERWPDVAALLAQLERGPGRRTRTTLLALGAGTLVLALAWPGASEPCADDVRLAEVWNATRREGARAAFAGTGVAYAAASWSRTEALIDGYADRWASLRRETCVAATSGDGMAAAELDARTRCLDDRLAALDAVVGVLVDADADFIQHSVTTAAGLPAVVTCRESDASAMDLDPTRAAERQSIGRGLTRVTVLENAGRYHAARGEAELLLARAERLDDPRLRAAAHGHLGSALHRVGEYEAARRHLEEGVWLGTAANDDLVVANAALDLVWLEGVDHADDGPALEWARHASAAIERQGEDVGRAQLAIAVGAVHSSRGHHAQALVEFERAREAFAGLGEEYRSDLATAHQNLGITLDAEGRHREGREQLERALAIYEEVQGPEHPETANSLDALAGALLHLGELEGARARFERALAIRSAALPVGHPDLARSHNNLGSLLDALGDYEGAEQHFRRAIEVFEAAFGERHPYLGATLANLANVEYHRGEHVIAREHLQRALAILSVELPADHPFVLQTSAWLARSDQAGDDADAARRHAEPVIAACAAGAGDPTICGDVAEVERWLAARE
ncbi:MAG TPA: tetratricopeptide repeat-containing protein kinase family protein, partial [Nannocystaceae bacterium]|nr:tetratricopeptide repeat-containing protein kinase family protein [Nannocystaceae bacterium]